ncbi:uncharacterized protein TRIADDRAFT_61180 [Trichoplax adhaerens]|uniref:Uncharacterized protein n=1 Tax=Trichoplax adhaerens TaxID=10228 RepID=B3SA92_TRIAD|nr:predicted protein [Trichoplax adhaerens]EDV20473.1 predicted protein [Trichoplax adhaerens]|eukprot:XP_002117167.1 predicted protein [Trichoplax adhaerens]
MAAVIRPQYNQQPVPCTVVQQPQITYETQRVSTSCCIPREKALSEELRPAQLGLGVTLLVTGLVSLILEIVGFFTTYTVHTYSGNGYNYTYLIYNPTTFFACGIWAGLFYLLAGIFAIANHKKQKAASIHLMNSLYAFSILGFVSSIGHVGISFGYLIGRSTLPSIWFNIVSLALAVTGSATTLTFLVILSRELYCKSYPGGAHSAHYQSATHVITMQQYPNQQVPIQYQPAQATYTQAIQPGPYTAVPNQISTNQSEPTKTMGGNP